MKAYMCVICGYVYEEEQGDPESGIEAGTRWNDVPLTWRCPDCGAMPHARKPASLSRTTALLLAAALLYIPANLLPIMTYSELGSGEPIRSSSCRLSYS